MSTERIINTDMVEQSKSDLQQYAIYVALRRAIPNAIDGLKPVARKIIWCAGHDFRNRGFSKTAAVQGSVIMKYNPHGDAAVQGAIRNMINNFSTKYPTMDGSGSWGNKANPTESAARYTDCKISNFSVDVYLKDIYEFGKRATDWMPTYDNKDMEPQYLPVKVPMLLVNGQIGIAMGIKVSIPSHNLGDVIDTTIKLIQNPNAKFCLIPDECMRCEILDTDWQKINDTGIGSYIAQGIIDIGEYNNHPALFVRSLPDFTYFMSIKEKIVELVDSGKMPYIVDIISKTRTDVKITNVKKLDSTFEEVIVLKKGSDPAFVREFLYANTGIRQTRQVRMLVVKDNNVGSPISYRDYLLYFINFRRMHVFRLMNIRLQKYKTDVHERELYLKAMTSGEIDKIIDMIRKQDTINDSELVQYLCKKLRVTDIQAKFLLNTDIRKLSKGYLKKYQAELKVLQQYIKETEAILLNPKKIDEYIIKEMLEIKEKYNDKKKCYMVSKYEASGIAPGIFKLIFTKNNFIKKIGENEAIGSLNKDEPRFVITADNQEDIIIFNELGKVFKMPVHKIPLAVKGSNGTDIRILNKYSTANICCAVPESILSKLTKSKMHNYIFVITRRGYIKKIDIADVLTAPPSGIIFSKLDEGDTVQGILFGPDKLDILIFSGNKLMRMNTKQVPYLKRSTKGNRASTATTLIDGMTFVGPHDTHVLAVTKAGYVNKIPLKIIGVVNRGKATSKMIKMNKTDTMVGFFTCNNASVLNVYDGKKTTPISIEDIKDSTTVSTGVKVCRSIISANVVNMS